ncbi:unnamed protein product [Prorocentrum cordatum]|uniref:Lon protease homolog n=1 Tax=Prorocentrum cordatum TaxID=2364126 RepID=A0ABN9T8E7_9DINO|nr:unnamed protein product [Polarella glacialis]
MSDASGVWHGVAILPLRNQVIFPGVRSTVEVTETRFQELSAHLERTGSSTVGALAARPARGGQKGGSDGGSRSAAPGDELFETGTLCRLVHHTVENSTCRLVVEGKSRFTVERFEQTSPLLVATVRPVEEEPDAHAQDVSVLALMRNIQERLTELLKSGPEGGKRRQLRWPSSAAGLAGVVGATLGQVPVAERQRILELRDVKEQLEYVLELVQHESEARRISNEISAGIQKTREQELKRVVLQRQIQEVQKDLRRLRGRVQRDAEDPSKEVAEDDAGNNDGEEEENEVKILSDKISKAGLPPDALRAAKKELRRLKGIQPQHPEYTITHSYLELLSVLPWQTSSEDCFDLARARAVLDEDHRGLDKVKVRILEFLAVQKMRGNMQGPILCLHGPPGIGKTSLGRSISRAMGRKFHRIALGGVRDEAELRGHRRTYIGSMPGVIIQAFQTLSVNNPVILLDEVDKMSQNSMSNPQATLLEILDPEQNSTFKDHYLNTPFDLSRVLFICTANDTSLLDRPLLDRMEVIELSGYTPEEKLAITASHLLPKQRRLHALEPPGAPDRKPEGAAQPRDAPAVECEPLGAAAELPPRLHVTEAAILGIIARWTSESGVRSLERRLAQICRWAALRLQGVSMPLNAGTERDHEQEEALSACGPIEGVITVDAQHLPYIIGSEIFELDIAERLMVGVAMGLSVSTTGGQLLFIEATRSRGTNRLTITGQLGKVMTESVETALSLLRSRFVRVDAGRGDVPGEAQSLKRLPGVPEAGAASAAAADGPFPGEDVHVHFPAGGIPKDGPSAGVAVLLALASLWLNRPMRSDTAVTGEVSLRGSVLPVGGIRDKVLAAQRAGVGHVLLPLANKRNVLEDVPARVLQGVEVHYVSHVDEALEWAFGAAAGGALPAEEAGVQEVAYLRARL